MAGLFLEEWSGVCGAGPGGVAGRPAGVSEPGSADDERAQRPVRDLEALFHPGLVAAPDRVLVLDRQDAGESALVQGVDDAAPVDVPESGHAVAPPALVPRVFAAERLAEEAVPVPGPRVHLRVLGLRVR